MTFRRLVGDCLPEAFDDRLLRAPHRGGEASLPARPAKTVTARLKAGFDIASQLRCFDQLLSNEREPWVDGEKLDMPRLALSIPDKYAVALGDHVLVADDGDVLALVDRASAWSRVEDLAAPGTTLRTVYGYQGDAWTVHGARVVSRIAVCLAADMTFAPYARGLLDAAHTRQATLRIDIRSAAHAIWAWAVDHRALARALAIARTDDLNATGIADETGVTMPLSSFCALFERVLADQLLTELEGIADADEVHSVSLAMAELVTRNIARAATPGGTADRNLSSQLVELVAEAHPDWLPDLREESPQERFALGASELVYGALLGRTSPEEALALLEGLSAQIRRDTGIGA